ncbi:hypothetical protein JNX00_20025 [Hydrogenophaga sp. YM1]|uniref:hypothetical protein n=1 Tax=Hydrogenophaga TaxID=47420 RepID=UPI00087823FD|nr:MULTISPECIES: hypothetical protein [unclassified Hydrogenophaga]MBN9370680.1 hypothetical protein [Hydrogenophaga sp.]OJV53837.1 MAG: hypothetical protein BGO22_04820 [Hydrogenophaga sp. 70-12]QRR33895.1 hypothetical protein JNX00_20025 [Hydrogenophaga sp. YM1]
MDSNVTLTAAHWMYLLGVISIIVTMVFRANVLVPSIAATFLVGLAWTGNPLAGVGSVYSASLVAAKELFNIFLVIALMTSLLNALKALKSDILMVRPFRLLMKNGPVSYLLLAAITYFISLFFWPTPAVPLVCAVLLPAAIAAGLPPIVGAAAIAVAGQGMALSSDYVIGVAPGISAKAAGAAAAVIADRALALSIITGVVALVLIFIFHRRKFQPASPLHLERWQELAVKGELAHEHEGTTHKAEIAQGTSREHQPVTSQDLKRELQSVPAEEFKWSKLFAIVTPLVFLTVIVLMVLPKLGVPLGDFKGGAGASLVGGAAALLMIFATLAMKGARQMLEASADHITEGFVFAFRAMGSVLPIAGFFFLGASETAAAIFGGDASQTPSLLFDLVRSAQDWIPHNPLFVAFGLLIVGMVTGIDGSGFSGLPLTGALAGALGPVSNIDATTLAAIGQMGAIWTGGGTLIAWSSLIAVAGFARVPVTDLVRVLALPVLIGLAASTVLAVVLF